MYYNVNVKSFFSQKMKYFLVKDENFIPKLFISNFRCENSLFRISSPFL